MGRYIIVRPGSYYNRLACRGHVEGVCPNSPKGAYFPTFVLLHLMAIMHIIRLISIRSRLPLGRG